MVSAIGSAQSSMAVFPAVNFNPVTDAGNFEEIISAASDSGMTDETSCSSKSSSPQAYDPADLNKDGTVSAEEALKYMQMQMIENMASEMGSQADSNSQMSQQHMGAGGNNLNSLEDVKMKQASTIYSNMENAWESALGSASSLMQGFSISV